MLSIFQIYSFTPFSSSITNNKLFTVRTVTLGGSNLKPIFDDRKLKNHIFVSFSPHRYNPSIMMGSFCRHASCLVVCERTSHCHKFTVRFIVGNDQETIVNQTQD